MDGIGILGSQADVVHLGTPWADFSLRFDLQQWDIAAFREDMPGLQSLVHRTLAGSCRITPNVPVGLGESWTFEQGQVSLGKSDPAINIHPKYNFSGMTGIQVCCYSMIGDGVMKKKSLIACFIFIIILCMGFILGEGCWGDRVSI